jgi:hypothetical protein
LARADNLQGRPRAEALADGLSEVDARFIPLFFADRITDLRAADPSDPTGYLAFLDGRRALDEFEAGLDMQKGPIDVGTVQSLIDRFRLRGETLQQALVLRAAGEVLAGEDRRALGTLAAVLDAQPSRTRFDRGDFVALDAESVAVVKRRIADGKADSGNGVAFYYALHRIFEFDMPNPYEISCGQGYRPNIRVRGVVGDRYGKALIQATQSLGGEARAKALAKGLDGTFFGGQGPIGDIVQKLIPEFVGKEKAKAILPGKYYPNWVR